MGAASRLHLGPDYQPRLWDVHKAVMAARDARRSLFTVEISAPINAPTIEAAFESGSLYLRGFRVPGSAWWAFAPDDERSRTAAAMLPGTSRPVMVGSKLALSTYRALRLDSMTAYCKSPQALLTDLCAFSGNVNGADRRLTILMLIFLTSEALRFQSIANACEAYVHRTPWREYVERGRARGENNFVQLPPEAAWWHHTFIFTGEIKALVRNWHSGAASNPDIWMPPA